MMPNVDEQQLELFREEGGLLTGDVEKDPVSGNDVPPGSRPEEVRDDIPAMLSENEYVVPADVVRYYGVKFFEDLRNEAKMGLSNMERNGRIGGQPVDSTPGDEPLSPEEEMMLREMMGMAQGGMVPQQNEVMSQMATQGYNPMEQQQMLYNVPTPAGNMRGFQEGGVPQSTFDFSQFGTVGGTYFQQPKPQPTQPQGPVIMTPYVNDAGEIRNIPMIDTDGDGVGDTPQAGTEIPEGFIPQSKVTVEPIVEDRDGGGADNRPSGGGQTGGAGESRRTGFSTNDLDSMINDPLSAINDKINNLGKKDLTAVEKKGLDLGLGLAGGLLGPGAMVAGAISAKGAEAFSKANDIASALAGLEHAKALGLINDETYTSKITSLQDLIDQDFGLDLLNRTGYISREADFRYNQILDKTTGTNITGPGPKSAIPMSTLGYDKPATTGPVDKDGPSWEDSAEGQATRAAAEADLAEARASGEVAELGTTPEHAAATGTGTIYNKGGLVPKPKKTPKKSTPRGKRGLGKG